MNIAPIEIDDVLLRLPRILDAASIGVADTIYGEEAVRYVAGKEPGLI